LLLEPVMVAVKTPFASDATKRPIPLPTSVEAIWLPLVVVPTRPTAPSSTYHVATKEPVPWAEAS
jgi:hypothetical protein